MAFVATRVISFQDPESRAGVYQLLALLWLKEVDSELLTQIMSPPLSDCLVAAGCVLPPDQTDQTVEDLALAYCKLFVGPANHLPPFQSVWQTGQFQGSTIQLIQSLVEIVDYDMERLPQGVMLDHLGVQLDIMGHILKKISTWEGGTESLNQVWELANSFFATNLLWPNDMFAAAVRLADNEFYRSLVEITRDFLQSEMLTPTVVPSR